MQHGSKSNFTTENGVHGGEAEARAFFEQTVNCAFVVELRCRSVQMLSSRCSPSSLWGAARMLAFSLLWACAPGDLLFPTPNSRFPAPQN